MKHGIDVAAELAGNGYGWINGADLDLTPEEARGRQDLPALWDDLVLDPYLKETIRLRRHARYNLSTDGELVRLSHEPYRQESEHNSLFGGQEREFEPCPPELDDNPYFMGLVGLMAQALPDKYDLWRMHAHMVRIHAGGAESAEPAPEGPHQDGFDFIAIHMIGRTGVKGGETIIYESGNEVATRTLREPGDGLILDDRRFTHHATPITVVDGYSEGSRDVFLFSFDPAPN